VKILGEISTIAMSARSISIVKVPPVLEQRWVRPFPTEPGFWKKQVPTKALALAVKGDIAGVERLLAESPVLLSKRGPHGRTFLWEAARRGHIAVAEWLLERGADVLATGCYNGESVVQLTPYCAAVYYRRPAVAALLEAAGGAELDVFRAAFMGDMSRVSHFLDTGPSLLNAEDPHDVIYYTPLIAFAVAGGQMAVTAALVERGANVTVYSAQLLRIALTARRSDLAGYLLDHGLDARAADAGIFEVSDDLPLLETLIERGASTTGVVNGFPPLVFVARGDKGEHPEKVALIIEHGANVNAAGGPAERTALHYAAAAGHARVAALLLDHGADRSIVDAEGQTPRDLAIARGRDELVDLL